MHIYILFCYALQRYVLHESSKLRIAYIASSSSSSSSSSFRSYIPCNSLLLLLLS